jgi:hypothetical protein
MKHSRSKKCTREKNKNEKDEFTRCEANTD